jgi:transcriptional regulator with XRE-family HTH domain
MPLRSPSAAVFVSAIGIALQKERQKAGLSQQELADMSGLHRTYISDIERRARNFSISTYFKLAIALGVQPSQLMKEVETLVEGGHEKPVRLT